MVNVQKELTKLPKSLRERLLFVGFRYIDGVVNEPYSERNSPSLVSLWNEVMDALEEE